VIAPEGLVDSKKRGPTADQGSCLTSAIRTGFSGTFW
jgi:hypothetical protein